MSFEKILIANRGEIACRVIATAQSLGYRTVAVYSEPDAGARHVQLADEAVCVGPALASASYLNVDALLDACRKTGADAVHPGYGFLSENAGFSRACKDAGITFIGPDEDAIHLMGSKRLSKLAMIEAGVPCIPGYEGEDQSDATLLKEAERIGLPLMIKASAGGGGRGMRVVTDASEIPAQLKSARQEAKSAFGSDELILERAVMQPRHVEIQVFGDRHGHVIHLGERDCSVQRRHQKVVEEAPSPAVDEALRQEMGEAAVNAAKACNYVGAGTVEFLLAPEGDFFFLEMNTRLQVEHPVTELVTGLDLVAWQIKVARGEPLPLTQEQVRLTGHAMEVRLYAEDPAQNYMPQTGPVLSWQPASGDGVRIDHGLVEGYEVGSHYDPMLAKIIAVGDSREDARRRLIRAVEDTVLMGVRDNRPFLAAILRHPVFACGEATTAFIGEDFADDASMAGEAPSSQLWALAALLRCEAETPSADLRGWHSSTLGAQPVQLRCGDHEQTVYIRYQDNHAELIVGENSHRIATLAPGLATIDGVQQRYRMCQDGKQSWLQWQGHSVCFEDATHSAAGTSDQAGSGQIRAPMDGAVIEVCAKAGDAVKRGQVLVIMEAMKMEHSLKADCDGTVESADLAVGSQVKRQQLLVSIKPDSPET
ncbi:3-methylcrotonyl-CoA carboxylase [Alcanivorax sp. HI0033]|uniref:acetyl/propionyl/methylcrotonyl-CoA carboxylase subunit alpha n=1 Tax=unclassified Alcanivorax TaxID=2638842 RepID=UPI0007B9B4CC|nr:MULTISPECIES: acetyl/propionyl/methylcrotonyl-CoA carboxylase subunit alpha [unclassified Alcanivorax]KZX77711.1 3-methylcrotonyl-CoA carboxylase [Alcanivorax sp. HI0011]KZX93682.1 3-methylcrotonyl-CoA carboxylase [Alcanivorax sp. HI0013]KZY19913.1 3-methylcrotonyl-CoA carboxylase [Alcanivorax sp. HI0035]KZX61248.1 3-methylcrotonyl-CoA carboxylase [Alcanivorax sp. HI0003]KZX67975.1 3-methylcrotonyl-CoA carboxylase [Alcanivorax sp. HI0007]